MESRKRFDVPRGESGYSWLYRVSALNGGTRVLITILGISLAAGFLAWWTRSGNDASPDSPVGLAYAVVGTLLLLLAGTMYGLRRRSRHRRTLGGLRASLGWHMCFALMGLAFLGMHSFGEFNLRTGTYALYGMCTLVISGLVGRALDRLMPRLIAAEVHKVLTLEGEDRLDAISQKLQVIVGYNTQHIRGFAAPQGQKGSPPSSISLAPLPQGRAMTWRDQTLHTPWDLAYISLESTPQELSREEGQYRFVPDKKSGLAQPGALMPGTQEQIDELEEVRLAMRRELFYRYITLYWRRFHIALALLTLGLVIWHIVFAFQLFLPTILH